jgi:UDP-N-acetylmuramoylalanine--D-glutamate ligase
MNVAIIGFARDGQAALKYWQDKGDHVTVCDMNEEAPVPHGIDAQLGTQYLKGLGRFDLIVRSSGINPAVLTADNPGIEGKITTGTNEFFKVCPTRNIIGITGTKGKSTTSALIAKMLEAAGKKTFFGGNVGIPVLSLLPEMDEHSWMVMELSSFQLHDLTRSPHIAVCLMMAPEHINWHGSADAYIEAKKRMFAYQSPDDIAIYFADNELSHEIASVSPGKKLAYYAEPGAYVEEGRIMIDAQIICQVDELKLLGQHNWQNACAAVTAAWQATKDVKALRSVLTTFTGLPHRLELVREVDGVRYYNDSFASAPPATPAAAEAIPGHKVMIIGGFDRLLPLDEFAAGILAQAGGIRRILLIGASSERVAGVLEQVGFKNYEITDARTMPEIVAQARTLAREGDAVVLSPGFPSFDMFKDFEVRGQEFTKAVGAL